MSPLAHTPLEDIRRQFEVNVVGQVAVTQVRAEPLLTFIRVCGRLGPHPTLPYPCPARLGPCKTDYLWHHGLDV